MYILRHAQSQRTATKRWASARAAVHTLDTLSAIDVKGQKEAIENLYSVFGKYTTAGIHYCDCGCIDEENVRRLNSKPLRKLEVDDIVPYHGSAIYTWGDVEHYKHYLPRIFELMSEHRSLSYIDLDEVARRLEHANWLDWPADEKEAINGYIREDWFSFANNENSEIGERELENYGLFLGFKELMELWKLTSTDEGIRNFTLFFYYHGSSVLSGNLKGASSGYEKSFLEMISDQSLRIRLEDEYFKHEGGNPEYADKVSVSLQMIEQELRIKKADNNE